MGGGLAFAGSLGRRGLRRGSKFLCVHAPDYFVNVRRGQVRVPLRHFGSLVAQHFAYGQEACAIHGKVARCRMPQVVEPEFLNAGSLQCETPWLAKVDWLIGIRCARKNEPGSCLDLPTFNQLCASLFQHLQCRRCN